MIDIGCGEGTLGVFMAERASCSVVGVDISKVVVSLAKEKSKELPRPIQSLLEYQTMDILSSLSIKRHKGRFDAALDVGCFHNFHDATDQRKIAVHVHQMLKPNGFWLLVIRAFRDDSIDESVEQEMLTQEIRRASQGLFDLRAVDKEDLSGPSSQNPMGGLAFSLKRTS